MHTTIPWLERLMPTARWRGFTDWLAAGFLGPIPDADRPPQQWLRLPSAIVRQMAQMADSWLLTVLKERQQRGLGWNEAIDGPLLATDLAARLVEARHLPPHPGWVLWWIEQEMRRLIRLVEAPERCLPGVSWQGLPYETRYRALALGLARLCQWYGALGAWYQPVEAREGLREAAARVRQEMTQASTVA